MRSFAIVVQKVAGRGKATRTAEVVQALLAEQGAESTLRVATAEHTLSTQVVAAASVQPDKECPCIVICGGDGSIQQGINALLPDAPPDLVIAVVPAGTCNDFASALGISTNPREIVEVLLNGDVKQIDLGRAGGRYFCTIATVGFESTLNRWLRNRAIHSPPRWLFFAAAIATLMSRGPFRLTASIDGNAIDDATSLSLLAANTRSYGGRIPIAPEADPSDGLFDVVLFQAISKFGRLSMLRHALAGRHLQKTGVKHFRGARLEIETAEQCEIWADGEPIGKTPISIEVVPGAIRMLVPRR